MTYTLMAVHAHPDDEATGTGGILARYQEHGARTVLVTCTGGEEGEIAHPSMATRENLAEVRRGELDASRAILGLTSLHLLGYRDSGMMGAPENAHKDSFHQADLNEAIGRLVALVRRERPHVLVTYDENGFYGHPDHIRANQITLGAWEAAGDPSRYPEHGLEPWSPLKLYYTAIAKSGMRRFGERLREAGIEPPFDGDEPAFGTPDELITTRVDVAPWVQRKRDALMAHRTQMGADVFFAKMPPEVFYDLFHMETFVRVASRVDAPLPEDDLFAGLE